MSWFNDTFGDSLNSLKGQITKITKEVLADDEATDSQRQQPENNLVKELEALCESKDLEIASLREEFNNLHSQYRLQMKLVENEGKTVLNDEVQIKKLESELVQLREERDHLNSCLDELQSEHQNNLTQVISLKDKYKSELEALKKQLGSDSGVLPHVDTQQLNKNGNDEINLLNSKLNALHLELEEERVKFKTAITAEEGKQFSLKEEIEKLLKDIQVISEDKKHLEEYVQEIDSKNKVLENKLIEKEKEHRENETKLKLLLNENKELLNKIEEQEFAKSKLSDLLQTEAEGEEKLKSILEVLSVDIKEINNKNNKIDLINLIENQVHECKKQQKNWTELTSDLKLEIKKLREENKNLQNELRMYIEKSSEMENKYQEEISLIKNSLSEMKTQEQECINQSQTDDVKKLEQEIIQCKSVIVAKNNEITEYSVQVKNLEQELKNLGEASSNVEKELLMFKEDKRKLDEENINLKNSISKVTQEKAELKEKWSELEAEKVVLNHTISELQSKIVGLEGQITFLSGENERIQNTLQEELSRVSVSATETDNLIRHLQNENLNLKNEVEDFKAKVIIKQSNLTELENSNRLFQEEVHKLQEQNNQLQCSAKETAKWKEASIDLQIQQEDLLARKEELENECLKLKNDMKISIEAKDAEIENLKVTNSNLVKSYNDLHNQLENTVEGKEFSDRKDTELDEKYQKQQEMIFLLQEENSELKSRVQKFQQQMKMQILQTPILKEDVQQHRRSKSAIVSDSPILFDIQKQGPSSGEDLSLIKQSLQQEQAKYQLLQHQFQEISNKEASARKEFERLKQHLIEIEDHYTEEAVESEKLINDLKAKLVAAEEQLQNSSTLYTSLKVRDNQHLESLQSQIKMISAQRDDLQAKLSAVEDEVQKHKASLMSLQIVLEQFQQDKEREMEEVAMKYEKQLQVQNDHFKNLGKEIEGLNNQLAEAKNGLKAASRLGEQLEKKAQQVCELEENLRTVNIKVGELEESLASANQASNGKVDKSLIKNLLVGYVSSVSDDRKAQVLRIMASVLDCNQDERNKMGVDASRSGWLSNILHPKAEGSPHNQSLAEAFIKFLENESRPQPQLKLLPELESNSPITSRTSQKPPGRLSELTLPTFSSSQENESSSILKNVLKDS